MLVSNDITGLLVYIALGGVPCLVNQLISLSDSAVKIESYTATSMSVSFDEDFVCMTFGIVLLKTKRFTHVHFLRACSLQWLF